MSGDKRQHDMMGEKPAGYTMSVAEAVTLARALFEERSAGAPVVWELAMVQALEALAREKADKATEAQGDMWRAKYDRAITELNDIARELDAAKAALAQMTAERDALVKFKTYVHQRLDEAAVPTHPKGMHSAQGCRIGDRLDWVLHVRDALRTELEKAKAELTAAREWRKDAERVHDEALATIQRQHNVLAQSDCDLERWRKAADDLRKMFPDHPNHAGGVNNTCVSCLVRDRLARAENPPDICF